jgi:hypothetical protein
MVRSVIAVIAGIATLSLSSFAIEAATKPAEQTRASLVFLFIYSAICVAAGGYVTAWFATRSKVRHAVIMGAIQAALVIPAMLTFPEEAPLWRWLVGMVLIVPAAWCGGVLYSKRADNGKPS